MKRSGNLLSLGVNHPRIGMNERHAAGVDRLHAKPQAIGVPDIVLVGEGECLSVRKCRQCGFEPQSKALVGIAFGLGNEKFDLQTMALGQFRDEGARDPVGDNGQHAKPHAGLRRQRRQLLVELLRVGAKDRDDDDDLARTHWVTSRQSH